MTGPTPLSGIRVIEFTHMVMGPTVGHILASLGAEVIRVEPEGGDQTRNLLGSGAGYFAMYNRHKQSICLDLKSEDGIATAKALCEAAYPISSSSAELIEDLTSRREGAL